MQPTRLMIERPGDRYWQLICKLRWIGMGEDEAHMHATLQLLSSKSRGQKSVFRSRDATELGTARG
jgi:hypothetical protein